MGGLDLFPNAKFYIQKREIDKWVWALTLGPEFRFLVGAADPADIVKATRLAREGRMIVVDGDREDVLPGIDLHLAADTHTYGSMYVTVRNDGARESADAFILAGDLIYTYDNLTGLDKNDPQLVPIGLAVGSQSNLMFTSADMLKAVGGEHKRVIPGARGPAQDRLSFARDGGGPARRGAGSRGWRGEPCRVMQRPSNDRCTALVRGLQARYFCYVRSGGAAHEASGLEFASNNNVGLFTRS